MTNIKSALQKSMMSDNENPEQEKQRETKEENQQQAKKKPVKKRRGRPSKVHRETKLHKLLEKRGMTRKDLHEKIAEKYPDEQVSPDAVSRIVSGNRKYYSTRTLYRICGALHVTPNMVLDFEKEII